MMYKIFISSRNRDVFNLEEGSAFDFTQLRLYLKDQLEQEKLLGKDFLEIVINERFATDGGHDSYTECLKQIEASNFTIALLSGSAGWAAESIDIGICHAELGKAQEISQSQFAIVDLRDFVAYILPNAEQEIRDKSFESFIIKNNRFNHPFKLAGEVTEENFKTQLLRFIKDIILQSISKRIEDAGRSYLANGGGQKVLEWKGMSYEIRSEAIIRKLADKVALDFPDTITLVKSIPDNMSVPEALNYAGRSFLTDQNTIQLTDHQDKIIGPIHFVGVYGTVTENQVRRLLGNPDIVTLRDEFGVYVWERTLNIQMVFLAKCSTPEATTINYNQFRIWVSTNGLEEQIEKRGRARLMILKTFVEAAKLI